MSETETTNVQDLINDLNKATENDVRETATLNEEPPAPNKDDFSAPEPPPLNDSGAPKASEIFTTEKAKSTAHTWVKWFNSLMKMSFPWFYEKTVLRKGDKEKMSDFVARNKDKSEVEMSYLSATDPEMRPVTNRFERYAKACEQVPLSEDEMNMIAEPLSELIIKYKAMQLGPEWSLVIAVFIVMLPRFEPLMPGLGQLFTKAQTKAS